MFAGVFAVGSFLVFVVCVLADEICRANCSSSAAALIVSYPGFGSTSGNRDVFMETCAVIDGATFFGKLSTRRRFASLSLPTSHSFDCRISHGNFNGRAALPSDPLRVPKMAFRDLGLS